MRQYAAFDYVQKIVKGFLKVSRQHFLSFLLFFVFCPLSCALFFKCKLMSLDFVLQKHSPFGTVTSYSSYCEFL